jgi:8-oxo-dGTP pyrophosphatase MutT (NUDIX family)
MNNYIDDIYAFIPTCDQEESDKKVILNYLQQFDNILLRENTFAHISSSGFIVNKNITKTLMIFHNIYQNWGWTGGHADGNANLTEVAIIEAMEETGLKEVNLLSHKIASLDILPVHGHYKNGKYVSSHMHLSIAYVLVADENADLQFCPSENAGVKWIDIDNITSECHEEIMHHVYQKLVSFARRISYAEDK